MFYLYNSLFCFFKTFMKRGATLLRKRNIMIALFVLSLIAIGIWILEILKGKLPYVDQWTREIVSRFDGTYIYSIFRWMTELGSQSFLIPFIIIMTIILWVLFRDYLPALIFAGGTLISHLINVLIKNMVARERPSVSIAANAEGHSFPSGHAMLSMVCYGLLAYFLSKKITSTKRIFAIELFFALLIFLIGLSRFFINVHYLTDIMAGFFIGFLCLIGLIYLYEFIRQ